MNNQAKLKRKYGNPRDRNWRFALRTLLIPVHLNLCLGSCKGQENANQSLGLEEDRKILSSISKDTKGLHPEGKGKPKSHQLGENFTEFSSQSGSGNFNNLNLIPDQCPQVVAKSKKVKMKQTRTPLWRKALLSPPCQTISQSYFSSMSSKHKIIEYTREQAPWVRKYRYNRQEKPNCKNVRFYIYQAQITKQVWLLCLDKQKTCLKIFAVNKKL